MYEITEAAKDAVIASWTPEKLRDVTAWAGREREGIHAKARAFMARTPSRLLRDAAEALDGIDSDSIGGGVDVPGVGRVDHANFHTIRLWVMAEAKARNVTRWHAAGDVQTELFTAEIAGLQGVEVDDIDWDVLTDELWAKHLSAYQLALVELGESSAARTLRKLEALEAETKTA